MAELRLIDPVSAQAYLRAQGWRYDDQFREIESYWKTSGGQRHTTLPLRPEAGDFALRMSEFVETVAQIEERSV